MKKCALNREISFVLAFVLALCLCMVASADITVENAIVTDYATGYVIYEKNADVMCVPASMTKVMMLYVFFSEMDKHNLNLNSSVVVSENAAAVSARAGLSNVRLYAGSAYSVDSLVSAVFVASACGASVALAEAISQTESAFVELMNQYAQKLGLCAKFTDCFGISRYNAITLRSMAALTKKIIDDYPFCLDYCKKNQIVWEGKTIPSTNKLLSGREYEYMGADGFKTGSTDEAGRCLASTAVRDNRRIISVVCKAETKELQFGDSAALLDYGFEHYKEKTAMFYNTACRLEAPQRVGCTEDFSVTATLSNVAVPMAQKGEWLVNDVPIAGYCYDEVWLGNGVQIKFNYNAMGFSGESLKITFRLRTPSDAVSYDTVVMLNHEGCTNAIQG